MIKLMEWPPRPPDFSPTKKLWEVFCQQVRKTIALCAISWEM
jgi:hypothetical protein